LIYKPVVVKPQGKRPFGRTKRRREDNIKTNLKEKESEGVDCLQLAQDRAKPWHSVNTAMKLRVQLKAENLTRWATMSFSKDFATCS